MLVDVCHMCDTVSAEMLGYVVACGGQCCTCRGRCQAREHSERGLTLSCLEPLWSYTGKQVVPSYDPAAASPRILSNHAAASLLF